MHIPIIKAHACSLLGLGLHFFSMGAITPVIEVQPPLSASGGFKSLIPANSLASVLIQLLSSHAVGVYKNCHSHFSECILRSHSKYNTNNSIVGFLVCNLCVVHFCDFSQIPFKSVLMP